jgi:hypothetical protein
MPPQPGIRHRLLHRAYAARPTDGFDQLILLNSYEVALAAPTAGLVMASPFKKRVNHKNITFGNGSGEERSRPTRNLPGLPDSFTGGFPTSRLVEVPCSVYSLGLNGAVGAFARQALGVGIMREKIT